MNPPEMVQRDQSHLAVVVSAQQVSATLRHRLLEAGLAPASITTSLRGLRRSLVLGEHARVTLCITLDQATLQRHGAALQTLMRDQRSFATTLNAIGITGRAPLSADAASIGCNVYLESIDQAVDAVCYFENATLPANPRCTGNWLHPQWMIELNELRVAADDNRTPPLGNLPDHPDHMADRNDEPHLDTEDTDAAI